MQPADFASVLLDALGRTGLMALENWPEWSSEQPLLWIIPGPATFSVLEVLFRRRRIRRSRRR